MPPLDRRSFLKLASSGLIAPWGGPPVDGRDMPDLPDTLGRVTLPRLSIYEAPDPESGTLGALRRDMVVPIFEEADTVGLDEHNARWFRVRTGWVYSSYVQPVRDDRQHSVVKPVAEEGFWGQVCVPFTDARRQADPDARISYRLYYSSVHHIVDAQQDRLGRWWYRIRDDFYVGFTHYLRAEHVRPIRAGALSPLSPDVEDKRVEVDLKNQWVTAYENGSQVYAARCATGTTFTIEGLGTVNFTTPTGKHSIVRKRPARHMVGGMLGRSDYYDLPGVPFCTYFTEEGAALHGAYWHNDFGRPRSHGCVNLLASDALWFYRWTSPSTPYAEPVVVIREDSTPIIVA